MDLIKILLVFVCLAHSRTALAIESNISTDRPQPAAPSAATTEFDRRPLVVHFSLERTTERPEDAPLDDTNRMSSENYSTTEEPTTTTTSSAPATSITELLLSSTTSSTPTITTTPSPITATASITQVPTYAPPPFCTLGEDTFQIGERWNPNLPPFGVQVCVLCECIIRPRKSCYEAKVTCRRITNECPVIDSCPDGKKPVTVPGQCCKSCQSTSLSMAQQENYSQVQQQPQTLGNQSPAYESQTSKPADQQQHSTNFKIVYMNERTKDYMSMVKNLPACPIKDGETRSSPSSGTAVVPLNPGLPSAPKAPKGSRNDLNGIDTRLAFKSLHDTASANRLTPSRSRHDESKRLEHSPSEDHHQHPNDVQSVSSSNNNNNNLNQPSSYGRAKQYNSSPGNSQAQQSSPHNCMLGNDTFQVGDVWNPILPPFGVQVCVRCSCAFRVRKGCYETRLTCRRINRDCPVIDTCPDGKPPVEVSGQCCKSCPSLIDANVEQQPMDLTSGGGNGSSTITTTISPHLTLDGIQRNEKVYREFQAITRNLNVCGRTRENTGSYNSRARRSD